MASILILGGGFGGLAAAHELRARLPDDHDVTVVAADDHFYAGFAKLWDLVGSRGRPSVSHKDNYATLRERRKRPVRSNGLRGV